MLCSVAQPCPASLCNPWTVARQARTRSGFPCPSQGIFANQDSNRCPTLQADSFYHLSHQGGQRVLEWIAHPFSGVFLTQESSQGLPHCRWILYQTSYQREAPSSLTGAENPHPPNPKGPDVSSCTCSKEKRECLGTALMFGDLPVKGHSGRTDLGLGSTLTIPQQHPFIPPRLPWRSVCGGN